MTNIEKIHKYLRVLVEVNESFQILTKNFPDLLEDLVSSKNSPSCSCNDRVIQGLTQKYQEDDEARMIIDDIFSRVQVVEAIRGWDEAIERWENQEKEIFEKVHKVGKTSEDWKAFRKIVQASNVHVQGFSVIEKEDGLEVRFI
jgi:DNA-binding transcriptional regulator GbsR (MarR family)